MNDIKTMADLQQLLLTQKTHVSPNEVPADSSEMDLCRLAAGIVRYFDADDVFQYVLSMRGAQEARVITIGDKQILVRRFGGSVVKDLLAYVRKRHADMERRMLISA